MQANYSCLLFDIDGTLLDFAAAERQAIEGVLLAMGIECNDDIVARFSLINAELWQKFEKNEIRKEKLVVSRFSKLLEELGQKGDAVRMNNDYMVRLSQAATIYPGADELLRELAEFASIAAVTNGHYKIQMTRLEKSGLLPFFDDVFVSERIGAQKPAPKIFNEALRKLGVVNRTRVLMIGDSLSADIKGGQNAGLHTCWMNFAGAENSTNIRPTYEAKSYEQLKLLAIGEEAIKYADSREKRHYI